jgi:hypothetical protein
MGRPYEASVVPLRRYPRKRTRGHEVTETETGRTAARSRTVRWIESLWEGRNTTSREEDQMEVVLSVFRELARESRSGGEVREYVPWQPLW